MECERRNAEHEARLAALERNRSSNVAAQEDAQKIIKDLNQKMAAKVKRRLGASNVRVMTVVVAERDVEGKSSKVLLCETSDALLKKVANSQGLLIFSLYTLAPHHRLTKTSLPRVARIDY